MNFSTIFLTLVYIILAYLHIKQNPLILKHDIKVARIMSLVLLITIAIHNTIMLPAELAVIRTFVHAIIEWILMILIYWKILSCCYKDISSKTNNNPE